MNASPTDRVRSTRRGLAICGLLWLFLPPAPAPAELARFEQFGFEIEMPEWWLPLTPAPPRALLARRGPYKQRTLTVEVTALAPERADQQSRALWDSEKLDLIAQHYRLAPEGHARSGAVNWTTLTGRNDDGQTVLLWNCHSDGASFLLRAEHIAGEIADDEEVLAAFQSFRFLGSDRPLPTWEAEPAAPLKASSPEAHPLAGRTGFLFLGITALLAILFTRAKKK